MIIVLIIDTFNVNNNGTTISAMRFADALTKHGHKVRVVTYGDESKNSNNSNTGYEMFYVPELIVPIASRFAHKQNTLFAKPVRSTLVKAITGADVVHIYQPWKLGSIAQKIARQLGVPAIAAFHIQPENITYNIGLGWFPPAAHLIYFLMYLFFYRRFEHIHCPSMFIAAQLRSHGYKARMHVISNGVYPEFCMGERDYNHKGDLVKILMVGRLSPEKRQDVLIHAVQKSQYADRIQLYFAGCGPWEKKLKRMGKNLPHSPVFGYYDRDKLIRLIRSCDLYIHASDIEIEGISCMEAFSCGLVPVISDSRQSATVQFALSQYNLFKAGSSSSLAERIDYWLEDEVRLKDTGERYAHYGQEYSLERSIRRMESVYASLSVQKKNQYIHGRFFNVCSRLFYSGIAIPILHIWTHVILGVKIQGSKNLRGLRGALTICNHVHLLDSALVALAFFPRKIVFPTLSKNLSSLWPGKIVRLLGGIAVPENITELKMFFDEMEFLLLKDRVIHFFPEGELVPYDTRLRSFKKGAFHLAAQARVPLVPMSISFQPSKGLHHLIRRKPVMVLHIGKPIYPAALDSKTDSNFRMEAAREQMNSFLTHSVAN